MRRSRLKKDSDDSSQKSAEHSESSKGKSVTATPISIRPPKTMKKLSQQQHQKQPLRCTNLVHIKQVERTDCASGSLIRSYQKNDRSSESLLRSSESGEDLASSNLSNECVPATSSGAPEVKKVILPSFSSDAQREPVQIQSESSLTLSLPKDITTSWLERERELFKESDSDVKNLSLHRPSLGEPGSRTTAKSIFSTNKSLVLENTRNSIQIVPDVAASDVLCRPPEFPADATPETSDFEDLHQFESLDASCPSHSDREFKSVPSKAGCTKDADLVPGAGGAKQVFMREQPNVASATSVTTLIRQPSLEERTVSERMKDCSCQHPVVLNLGTTLDATSTVMDATLPRPGGPCNDSVTESEVRSKTSQNTLNPRKCWSQDMLTVSPSTSGPLQNLVTVEADVLAAVRDNITSRTTHDDPGWTFKTSERSSVLEYHVPRRKSPVDSSVDDDGSVGVPEGAPDDTDASYNAPRMSVKDVGTNLAEAVAVQSVSPKLAHRFEKLNSHTFSRRPLESAPDDVRECIKSSCAPGVSREDIARWTCPQDLLFDDVGAVAGVPDFVYFEVDPTHGFPRRSSAATENTTIGEKSIPGILSPSLLAALRAQYSQGRHEAMRETSAERVVAESSATNCSSFTTIPTVVQTKRRAVKPTPSLLSETSDTFKTTEEKSPSDHLLPHPGPGNGATSGDMEAAELENQSNDFSVEVPVEETFRHERVLTESDSRGFQPSFTTEVCHREKELSSVTETSASTLEEERANVDISVKNSGDFSLSKEGPLASSKSLSSHALQRDEFPPVFSFSAEEQFDTASSAHTKDEGSAEDAALLSDFPESLVECASESSRDSSEQKVDGETNEQDLATVVARQRAQRGPRRALVAYWRHRRAAPVTEIFLGPHPSFSDSPPAVTTSVVPLSSCAVVTPESPFGRLFGPRDMPTCVEDACVNKEEDDSASVRGTTVATHLDDNSNAPQDLSLDRLLDKDEPRTSPSRASGSVLEATYESLDAAAPVIAISFAVLALVAAATILLQREPSGPDL